MADDEFKSYYKLKQSQIREKPQCSHNPDPKKVIQDREKFIEKFIEEDSNREMLEQYQDDENIFAAFNYMVDKKIMIDNEEWKKYGVHPDYISKKLIKHCISPETKQRRNRLKKPSEISKSHAHSHSHGEIDME